MKILHTITSIDISSGGPSKSVCDLALNQAQQGLETSIITNASSHPYLTNIPNNNLKLNYVKDRSFKIALIAILKKDKFDIMHGHGIWQMPVHYMALIARHNKVPYIISPRGMLEPWALNYKKWKKKLALLLYQNKDLQNASCIHATAQMEADQIRKLGFKNSVAIIPNPIEVKVKTIKIKANKKRIAFIGRFHQIKNLENLIHAWSIVDITSDWELILIGDGDSKYVNTLKKLVNKLRVKNIIFTGFLIGEEKEKIMQTLDVLILPSKSENFGMVVGEALQNEIPVIASTGTPWEDLDTYQCGWWVNNDINTLAQTIQQAILLTDQERQIMGKRGRQLIIDKYSNEIVTKQMIELYEWLINKQKPKLTFVYE